MLTFDTGYTRKHRQGGPETTIQPVLIRDTNVIQKTENPFHGILGAITWRLNCSPRPNISEFESVGPT